MTYGLGNSGVTCTVKSYLDDKKYPEEVPGGIRYKNSFALFDVIAKEPEFSARGDAPYHVTYSEMAYTVPYGQTVYYGATVCDSQEEGLTCWNVKTGYGVFMSREGYRIFSF